MVHRPIALLVSPERLPVRRRHRALRAVVDYCRPVRRRNETNILSAFGERKLRVHLQGSLTTVPQGRFIVVVRTGRRRANEIWIIESSFTMPLFAGEWYTFLKSQEQVRALKGSRPRS